MEKINFVEIENSKDKIKGDGTKISFWFTSEDRREACLVYSIYKTLTRVDVYTNLMTVEHSITFKLDDTREYYVNKLECGLRDEILKQEKNGKYDKDVLAFFKDNPTISEIFEKVSDELEGNNPKKDVSIMDITKDSPLFDSKELLKLFVDNKHFITLSVDNIYECIINIKYKLDGLLAKNITVPLIPSNTLTKRMVEAVKDYERDNNVYILPKFLNESVSDRFAKNIELLKVFRRSMKDTTITSIEVNPMSNAPFQHEFMSVPIDPRVFYLDIKVTRKVQDEEVTNGYVFMREYKIGESLMHHYYLERMYMNTLYRYEPDKKIDENDIYIRLRPLDRNGEEVVISHNGYRSSLKSISFGKVSYELCKYLGKDMEELMNAEYAIGSLIGFVYNNEIRKPYDSDVLDQINETQIREVYAPFIEEVINVFSNEYDEYFKAFGRFSKIDQIRSSVVYNFRNLLAELNDELACNTIVSEADSTIITDDCEYLRTNEVYKTIETKLSKDTGKTLTQITSLRDTLHFYIHLRTTSGKTVIRIMEILLTKDGPIISCIIGSKKYRDTKKFKGVQDSLKTLLGDYLYGLLTFLGKLLYIYELLNDNVRNIQYVNVTEDGETTNNVVELTYEPVTDVYLEYIKKLRYKIEPEEEFVNDEEEEEY